MTEGSTSNYPKGKQAQKTPMESTDQIQAGESPKNDNNLRGYSVPLDVEIPTVTKAKR